MKPIETDNSDKSENNKTEKMQIIQKCHKNAQNRQGLNMPGKEFKNQPKMTTDLINPSQYLSYRTDHPVSLDTGPKVKSKNEHHPNQKCI